MTKCIFLQLKAGIPTDQLSLAIEPEAASLFCRHLPVEQIRGADGEASLSCLAPGKRYLVLDAGGIAVFKVNLIV